MLKEAFYLFYGGVTMLNIVACFYLLFRRGNAIAPDITSLVRLRRWTAAFFAVSALSHLWNLPVFFLTSGDNVKLCYLVGALLDCMTVGPLAIVILFAMLQDRRRPLWLVAVMFAPPVIIMALCVAYHSDALMPILYSYAILLIIGLIIYVVCAVRQYGRWLRDNYSDLEHKEVWQSFVVLAAISLALGLYTFDIAGLAYEFAIQMLDIILTCYLLWRVETLSDLSISSDDANEGTVAMAHVEDDDHSLSMRNNIGPLLKQHCEESRLYLQYDISLTELAKQIGTNRVYLSQHFAMQGTTYNTYINNLRIKHFISLYNEAAATHQPTTIQQLAYQSGFRSYGTFNTAFKQSMGMTATKWMRMKIKLLLAAILIICYQGSLRAQSKLEEGLKADFVSSYIWRGLNLGHVSLQPELSIGWKGLSLSAWGSVGLTNHKDDITEIDLTLSYETRNLSFGIIDYWCDEHDKRYFYYKKEGEGTGHSFEGFVSYDFGPLSVSWQTFFAGNDYQDANDKRSYSSYFQLMAPFRFITCDWEATAGLVPWASDYYSANGFSVTNLSLKATKDIRITDSFSLPLFTQIVANPASQKMYFVAGFTLNAF